MDLKMKNPSSFFWLLICCFVNCRVGSGQLGKLAGSGTIFNVMKYGARADGRTDDGKAFLAAWTAACSSSGVVNVLIPRGTYLLGPVKFIGPCKNVQSITVHMKGYLKASTDLSEYANGAYWVEFGWIENLTLTGKGTFDGQGAASWAFDNCPKLKNCQVLPTSIKLVSLTNTRVKGIKSINSKFFHVSLVRCQKFHGSKFEIVAPENSPNTDGIHIDRSSGVRIYSSKIGTGDDCVSIGEGNTDILISGVTCGPGHGISVGSLGRYKNEKDVEGLVVEHCTFLGTTNGIRIKTWENSPKSITASNMTFQNIEMNSVANPIIIDQTYCPYSSCPDKWPSKVQISDIHFKNIKGTTTTPVAVTLRCSRGSPCKNINLHNVHLKYVGGAPTTATCSNAKVDYSGTQIPPPCGGLGSQSSDN